MIQVVTRTLPFFKRQEIWFYRNEEITLTQQNLFYQAINIPKHYPYQEFTTLITLLGEHESVLWNKISRTFQYHIRKAEKSSPVSCAYFSPNEDLLKRYLSTHRQFAATKSIQTFDPVRLTNLIESRNVCITTVDIAGQPVIFHCYLVNGSTARLLSSHDVSTLKPSERGYLNKFLHWHDILMFKKLDYDEYDWGGISNEVADGRRFFKVSFGGNSRKYYNFVIAGSIYRIAKACINFFKKR